MSDALLRDLPGTLPAFIRRFGTDAKCRAYLVRALWPEGFRCSGCGHREAHSHKRRSIDECRSCGKQHAILAGTMFEQTKLEVVPRHLPVHRQQGRHLGDGAAAADGLRQLRHCLGLAAQNPAGDDPAGP